MFRSKMSVAVNATIIIIIDRTESKETVTSTTFQAANGNERGVPVVGYPGPVFSAIHVSALVTLSVSTLVLIGLFLHLCGCRRLIGGGAGRRIARNDTSNGKSSSTTSGMHTRRCADTSTSTSTTDIDAKIEERGENRSGKNNSSAKSASAANANRKHDSEDTRGGDLAINGRKTDIHSKTSLINFLV